MENKLKDFAYYDQEKLERDLQANLGRPYQQCAISVMDTIADPYISFDNHGICNYYYEYKAAEANAVVSGNTGKEELNQIFSQIRETGSRMKYDCILGLSGGVDSTYLCWLAKEMGLRPLIVHFDNGWNSELAIKNIENVINKLNLDLYTYVVDWNEFKDMQLAYLKASVVDIEVLTDHAFMAVLYEQARKNKIRYVLAGMNIVTEQVLPKYWIYSKGDSANIKDIQSKFGRIKPQDLKTYPFLHYSTKRYCDKVLKMSVVAPLNYIEYKYDDIKQFITANLGWRDYGGKHYESVWTRFYQGYILPRKFNIDKRKAHLSNLIFSGQITRDEALQKLNTSMYDYQLLEQDKEYVIKKLGLTLTQFEELMLLPRREHIEFKTQRGFRERFPIIKYISKLFSR